jgi:hypothetical protein
VNQPQPAPGLRLTRLQLTLLFALLTLGPVAAVVWVVIRNPAPPDPQLVGQVELGIEAWHPPNQPEQLRLTPSLILVNHSADTWDQVSLMIDKKYYYYSRRALQPGERLVVPLDLCTTRGNVRLRPSLHAPEVIAVFAQLPSGARGVLDQPLDATPILSPQAESD